MERNDSILGGALLLTAANLLLRLISIAFQVFLSVRIGAAGLGLMQLISTIGVFAMLAGTAGVRVTAMYLAAEEFGHRRLSGVRAAMRACLQYGILVSAVSGAALFFLSDFFAMEWLRDLHQPKKFTPATIEFVDIAGLVKGASKGEGLGNKFLSNIRTTDAIIHVVRCFDDPNVTHVEGSTDPLRDIDIINLELILADAEMCERRMDKAQKAAKGGDKRFLREAEVFSALLEHLNEGKLARTFECSDDDRALIATSDLLTLKRTIYAANVSEDAVNDPESVPYFQQVKKLADEEGSLALPICAKLEADIAELDDPDEKAMFMEELGLKQSGLDRLIQASYELLGLISFLTAGSDECRAWTIKKGTRAPQAAGKIHSDFERGFIRAEVIAFDDLKACGTMAAAKAKGLVRSEGKEYVMKDGDIVNFLFNV
jgi:GTP-binding protein YchF